MAGKRDAERLTHDEVEAANGAIFTAAEIMGRWLNYVNDNDLFDDGAEYKLMRTKGRQNRWAWYIVMAERHANGEVVERLVNWDDEISWEGT